MEIQLRFPSLVTRDYQKDIVAGHMDSTKGVHGGGGLLEIPCGRGKCHARGRSS